MAGQNENPAFELARLSAEAMEILLDEAEEPDMFEETLRLNGENREILKLLCGHPGTPPAVREEAARALGAGNPAGKKAAGPLEDKGPGQTEEAKRESIAKKIRSLTVGEKIRISMKAGREARALLLKDANKQVVLGVMANPRITISEVEMAARSRSMPEEALREIAKNKEWVKSYTVICNLVSNAKTPAGVSLGFLPWIKSKDLHLLVRNKDVPDVVRTAARKFAETRDRKRQS